MKSKFLIFFVPLIIFQMIFPALPLYSAEEDLFKKNSERGIAFISGGVSQTEREILKERGKGYTLKLIFSSKKGEYLSNVIVKVLDQKNQTILLTVSNGPWLFIDLPNGIYEIEASFSSDRKEISRIKIERGKQKVFHLRWQVRESPESG